MSTLQGKELNERIGERLVSLYEQVQRHSDQETTSSLVSLMKKTKDNDIYIALCGHFSAGKSSFINEMFGEGLLPTSPIPTSANTVAFSYGEAETRLYLNTGEKVVYPGEYTKKDIQAMCKNGEQILHIEMKRKHPYLAKGVVFIDTPGVDSTDDAHKLATEKLLPSADCILYMMDYNHVQAAVNIEFVRTLKKRGKQLYIFVNQIDKHKEEELPFHTYQQSTREAFAALGVAEEEIFFLSLYEKEHPHNDLQKVKALMESLYKEKETERLRNYEQESMYVIEQHMEYRKESLPNFEHYREEDVQQVEGIINNYNEEKEGYIASLRESEQQFQRGITDILQNAYIMSYEVRELVKSYLESISPNFKVGGLFFAKGKTEKEKEHRYRELMASLLEAVKTQIDVHMKEFVKKFMKQQDVSNRGVEQRLYELAIPISDNVLIVRTNGADQLTGEYVLFYCDSVVNEIKRVYKEQYVVFYQQEKQYFMQATEEKITKVDRELSERVRVLQDFLCLKEAKQQWEEEKGVLIRKWQGEDVTNNKKTVDDVMKQYEVKEANGEVDWKTNDSFDVVEAQIVDDIKQSNRTEMQGHITRVVEEVKKVEEILTPFPALHHLQQTLGEKRERVENRRFTIALFGAFSAGKSSFANALVGEKILPSSPNPTTATINRITAPTDKYPHGTVVIYEKDRTFTTDISELEEYVAKEERAKYVERVDIHYACNLTNMGVTLVDTPGADSMNNRHTDVAFEYIKNADAIFFVTYYNHVFSRGDREFLIQLGRVKNTFELDKMFFLINAIDLAKDEDELHSVKIYIEQQLLQYGIRQPRIFGVSSQQAMKGERKKSRIEDFEESFYRFLLHDLVHMSLRVLQDRMVHTEKQVTTMIRMMTTSEEEKQREYALLVEEREQQRAKVMLPLAETEQKAFRMECEELLYYVKKRVFVRLHDVFVEFFNPSVVKKDKTILQACLVDLLKFLEHDIVQEIRATSLRLEKYMKDNLQYTKEQLKVDIQKGNEQCDVSFDLEVSFRPPTFHKPFEEMDMKRFQKALALFKNPKAFFENNEKALMEEEIQQQLEEPLSLYTETTQQQFVSHYMEEYANAYDEMQRKLIEEIDQFYTSLEEVLLQEADIELYEKLQKELRQIIAYIS
ncbi:dynamin family protein [Priestia taiwanensis]|uniref:GTPase n=1 Tax=Priestia taiwanensis TaxID=1347902 RepID=A0A917EKX3_9BACI|nr:dynamin family protein [Priestia taiwanensis]MBM7361756.1 putative GTPase [Priestia taiwanensis]GGE56737.1 GTPase [Priestia taiwanensis]